MPAKDPRIDAYIKGRAPFAQPILKHLRAIVHEGCPDVVETVKWGMPAFEHRGPLCSFAAFKAHAVFGFWKGGLILDSKGRSAESAMGSFGRLTSLDDLPSRRVLVGYVKKAVALNEQGIKVVRKVKPKSALPVPAELKAALARNARARATFTAFSPSCRREYVEWISEAKQDATRARRIATAVEWMAEGKKRNWKYEKC